MTVTQFCEYTLKMLNCILQKHEFNNIWTITQQQQKTIDNGTDLVIEEKCVLFEEINKLSLGGSDGKESSCNAVDPGSIHESRRSPGERNVYPLQYTCLDNFMDIDHPDYFDHSNKINSPLNFHLTC